MSCSNCSCSNDKENLLEFVVSEDIKLLVQKNFFELSSITELMIQFTSNTAYKPDKERYLLLLDDYKKQFINYNLVIYKLFINTCEKNNLNTNEYEFDNINFNTNKVFLKKK